MIVTQHRFECPCCHSQDRVYIITINKKKEPGHECRNCGSQWQQQFDKISHQPTFKKVLKNTLQKDKNNGQG